MDTHKDSNAGETSTKFDPVESYRNLCLLKQALPNNIKRDIEKRGITSIEQVKKLVEQRRNKRMKSVKSANINKVKKTKSKREVHASITKDKNLLKRVRSKLRKNVNLNDI